MRTYSINLAALFLTLAFGGALAHLTLAPFDPEAKSVLFHERIDTRKRQGAPPPFQFNYVTATPSNVQVKWQKNFQTPIAFYSNLFAPYDYKI